MAVAGDLAISDKSRHFALVSEILAPRLPFLGRTAKGFTEPDECLPKGMGIDIRQPGRCESVAEDLADWSGCAPGVSGQPGGGEIPVLRLSQSCRREKRIVWTESQLVREHGDVGGNHVEGFRADRKEVRHERLPAFRVHLAAVLKHRAGGQVDVFEPKGCQRPVARPGQDLSVVSRPSRCCTPRSQMVKQADRQWKDHGRGPLARDVMQRREIT